MPVLAWLAVASWRSKKADFIGDRMLHPKECLMTPQLALLLKMSY
jgi:hypothetical protein